MQINRSPITQNILNSLAFVKSKLQTPQAPPQTPQYGQVQLPLPKLEERKKLILMFVAVSITTALILPEVIRGIKVLPTRPAITMNLLNNKAASRICWDW